MHPGKADWTVLPKDWLYPVLKASGPVSDKQRADVSWALFAGQQPRAAVLSGSPQS
jgi:hypothetical protein